MRVLVTGADGFIGRPLVRRLLEAGHAVVGLARNADAARRIDAAGAQVVEGGLADLDLLTASARASDAVVHLALELGLDVGMRDRAAIDALLAGLEGSGKPFVGASAAGLVGDTGAVVVDETRALPSGGPNQWRVDNEARVLAARERGIRAMAVRPAPLIHGQGGGRLLPALIEDARRSGVAHHVGSGAQAWSTAHVDDTAALFALVLEHGSAGEAYFAASDMPVPWTDIARAVSRVAGARGRTERWTVDEAIRVVGFLGGLMAIDVRVSNAKARRIGWSPDEPSLLDDIEGAYAPRD